MSDVQFVPGGGMIGYRHRKVTRPPEGVPGPHPELTEYQEGAILGFRKGGDEVLFAAAGIVPARAAGQPEPEEEVREDQKVPLVWIPVTEFSVNQVAVATEDDFVEEELVEVPHGQGPLPQRQIRRREA
jgi:hypothetical protein